MLAFGTRPAAAAEASARLSQRALQQVGLGSGQARDLERAVGERRLHQRNRPRLTRDDDCELMAHRSRADRCQCGALTRRQFDRQAPSWRQVLKLNDSCGGNRHSVADLLVAQRRIRARARQESEPGRAFEPPRLSRRRRDPQLAGYLLQDNGRPKRADLIASALPARAPPRPSGPIGPRKRIGKARADTRYTRQTEAYRPCTQKPGGPDE